MKKILLLLLNILSLCSFACQYSNRIHSEKVYCTHDTSAVRKLIDAHNAIQKDSINTTKKQHYFDLFPHDFYTFVSYFGFYYANEDLENSCPCLLYFDSMEYLDMLFETKDYVDESIFYNKIINLCINGWWDADGVSYLQTGIHQIALMGEVVNLHSYLPYKHYVLSEEHILWKYLNEYSSKEIKSFFHFYIDNAEYVDEDLYIMTLDTLSYYTKLKKIFIEEYNLLDT